MVELPEWIIIENKALKQLRRFAGWFYDQVTPGRFNPRAERSSKLKEELRLPTEKVDLTGLNETDYQNAINRGGGIIKDGGIVAFPTETVYGLGADAFNSEAVRLIFTAKGRPADNPLIIHVADKQIQRVVEKIPEKGRILMDKFWPGPLTIIFQKAAGVPDITTAGLATVGVRMPDNQCALDLIKAGGGFIAAPSANISGRPSPTNFERSVHDLDGRCHLILGLDQAKFGLESTIIDVTTEPPELLRPGAVTLEMLREAIGEVKYLKPKQLEAGEKPRAPGMKYRHYAPRAEVTIVNGPNEKTLEFLLGFAQANGDALVILISDSLEVELANLVRFVGVEEASRKIFETLRRADDLGFRRVYIQGIKESGLGMAYMNRIKKAAGYRFLEVE